MSSPAQLLTEVQPGSLPGDAPAPSRAQQLRTMLKRPSVVLCLAFLTVVFVLAIFAPLVTKLSGYGPYEFDAAAIDPNLGGLPIGPLGGISSEHWFGVEPQNGRDLFARIFYGARISLLIAFSATVLTTLIGTTLGMVGGFFGGWADQIVSRTMDFLMAFPALIFMIALLSALPQGNRPLLLILVLSFFGWPYIGRVIRSQTLSIARREYIEAAVASGGSKPAIVFREVLPNLVGTIIVMSTLSVPLFIGTEAGLSFLGVGLTPPTASWGQMISAAVSWYAVDPMYFFIPGSFLFLTVLTFTVIGDHLQAALDPRGGSR